MAPTICSDEKSQIRPGIKHIRRHSHQSQLQSLPSSSILSYVAKGTMNYNSCSSLRVNSKSSCGDIQKDFEEQASSKASENIAKNPENPMQFPTQGSYDSDASYDALSLASSTTTYRVDDRFSPYSFHHDDENFSSCDSEFNNQFSPSTNPSECTSSIGYQGSRSGSEDFPLEKLPFSASQLSQVKNTSGLFEIAVKTVRLVKRNQLLQRRLAQLQLETSEFIQSVLANPENRSIREKIQQKEKSEST